MWWNTQYINGGVISHQFMRLLDPNIPQSQLHNYFFLQNMGFCPNQGGGVWPNPNFLKNWRLLSTDDYLQLTTDYYWWLLMTTDDYWRLLMITDDYWCLPITTNEYWWLLTTTDYYWLITLCSVHIVHTGHSELHTVLTVHTSQTVQTVHTVYAVHTVHIDSCWWALLTTDNFWRPLTTTD